MSLPAVTTMKKHEIVEELTEAQAQGWTEKMSMIELRAILQEVRKAMKPEQNELKGLTVKKLDELQGQYRRLTGQDPEGMTRGLLMAAIRNHVTGVEPPPKAPEASSSSTAAPKSKAKAKAKTTTKTTTKTTKTSDPNKMNFSSQELRTIAFGKHKGTTYEDAMPEYPQYCEWVLNTYEIEDECTNAFKHFAVYLLKIGFNGREPQDSKKPETEEEEKVATETSMDQEWDNEF